MLAIRKQIIVLILGALFMINGINPIMSTTTRDGLIINPPSDPSSEVIGSWEGILKVMGMNLKIVFNIEKSDEGLKATMDSPDQGAFGIPVSEVLYEFPQLTLTIKNAGITYQGTLSEDYIKGNFSQSGQDYSLDLQRTLVKAERPIRPQEPQPPYPYHTEDVYFVNESAKIRLAGTLSTPFTNVPVPAVVLITGSGAQNRNEEILGHKPFLVIADHLTRNGFAVLRFDDRGYAESEGEFHTATTLDFATDAEAAVAYLQTRKEIDRNKIGLIGHSEGGIIASIVAARNESIGFIVLLAGTGLPGDQIMLMQQELIGRVMGTSEDDLAKTKRINQKTFEIVRAFEGQDRLSSELRAYISHLIDSGEITLPEGTTADVFLEQQMHQIDRPWMLQFLTLDPALYLEKVRCPVLALIGENDLQVPPLANLMAIQNALEKAGNTDITTLELPGLNHLFQHCETGSPDEYAKIAETFAPFALEIISTWLKERAANP